MPKPPSPAGYYPKSRRPNRLQLIPRSRSRVKTAWVGRTSGPVRQTGQNRMAAAQFGVAQVRSVGGDPTAKTSLAR
jgi:hypothetical protein